MSAAVSPDGLRGQRKNAAVLKVNLARLRERSPCVLVVVLEGKDDLSVYEAWIKRVADPLEWEPIIAHGKRNVLEFRELVRRDQTGIGICTYFIVDHDYDGLRGAANDDDIYVLPAYSVESYLTEAKVFDSFLRTDLHVVGDPEERAVLLDRFKMLESSFIDAIKPACAKLYGARNEKVGNVIIEENIGEFIEICRDAVKIRAGVDIGSVVRTDLPVSADGCAQGAAFLECPNPRIWIRGKFVFYFYKKVCELFYEDRRSPVPFMFAEQGRYLNYTPASFDFYSLAAKSALPEGFLEKIDEWVMACGENCVA